MPFEADTLLGFLTITMPVKAKLKHRESLKEYFKEYLEKRNEYEDELLAGL